MKRAESERIIGPIISMCQQFSEACGENAVGGVTDVTPDVRRVSLIHSLASSLLGDSGGGNGLEVGSGYGYLLFSLAVLMPRIQWHAVDHPQRVYLQSESFRGALREHHCSLVTLDITRDPLPFPNEHFSVVTFSEVLEHLPIERVGFVLGEIVRVVRGGGILLVSSPNQASLENRLRLLRGHSILDMPSEMGYAKGTFGHIRLYTVEEIKAAFSNWGLSLERKVIESNNSGYRGKSGKGWQHRAYRWYESLERNLPGLRSLGDTWYLGFRKHNGNI